MSDSNRWHQLPLPAREGGRKAVHLSLLPAPISPPNHHPTAKWGVEQESATAGSAMGRKPRRAGPTPSSGQRAASQRSPPAAFPRPSQPPPPSPQKGLQPQQAL
uniref:Uncharacterized protein n=1 Tax=Sphaerodactylus townsendi TaxID=933632 RepID=A0ACB8F7L8_9SAUR